MNLRRVLVVGASGFIGSAIVAELRRRAPEASVTGIGSSDLDLSRDDVRNDLARLLGPDVTVVVALRANAVSGQDVLEAELVITRPIAKCLRDGLAKRCLYLSSIAVHGERTSNLAIDEHSQIDPTSHYGLAKFCSEKLLSLAASEAKIPLLILRPSQVYGPGDRSRTYGPSSFIPETLAYGRVTYFGDGSDRRDHLYVKDLAAIVVDLARSQTTGVLAVGTGSSHSAKEVAEALVAAGGGGIVVETTERRRPRIDLGINNSRLRDELPKVTFTPIEDGLAETWRHAVRLRRETTSSA